MLIKFAGINSTRSRLHLATAALIAMSVLVPRQANAQGAFAHPAIPEEKRTAGVAGRIEIAAPPEVVWTAIHEERDHAPGLAYSKVLSEDGNASRVEQKIELIPFVKSATRIIDFTETPKSRIDFATNIDDVNIEGSWRLESAPDGQSTVLTLSTYSDSQTAHRIGKPFVKLWIHRRLSDVRKFALRDQQLQVNGRILPKSTTRTPASPV